jgi:hypothetical protein
MGLEAQDEGEPLRAVGAVGRVAEEKPDQTPPPVAAGAVAGGKDLRGQEVLVDIVLDPADPTECKAEHQERHPERQPEPRGAARGHEASTEEKVLAERLQGPGVHLASPKMRATR